MIYKIYNGVEILIDESDFDRLNKVLKKGCEWHLNKVAGSVAGCCKTTTGKYKKFHIHRVIMNCYDYCLDVDHINRNQLDNRKENLRICEHRNNVQNQGIRSNNTSGYKGVYWSKEKEKWCARIRNSIGYKMHLGYFMVKEDAAKAYNEAALKYHKEFASLNIILQ